LVPAAAKNWVKSHLVVGNFRLGNYRDLMKVFLAGSDHLMADAFSSSRCVGLVARDYYFIMNDVDDLGGGASEIVVQEPKSAL
jgi:hypothetical protein